MIRSMTGFASLERQYDFGRLVWEMRSVNHRYLEVSLRLPEEFRVLEPKMRTLLGRFLSRGKIDATLRYHEAPGAAGKSVVLNQELATSMLALHKSLGSMANLDQQPDLSMLLRWPGLVTEQSPDPAPLQAAALELLEEAATELDAGRAREGEQMANAITERLDGIVRWVGEVDDREHRRPLLPLLLDSSL